jgi:hypothetical protein
MVTFEQTDALVESAVARRACGTSSGEIAATGPMASVCAAYAVIQPILKAVEAFPLLPAKWKKVIAEFIAVMDALCPRSATAQVSADAPSALTFEAIDAEVGSALVMLLQSRPAASQAGAAAVGGLAGDIAKICSAYKAVRPILDFAKQFLPAKLALAITLAEQAFDAICKV